MEANHDDTEGEEGDNLDMLVKSHLNLWLLTVVMAMMGAREAVELQQAIYSERADQVQERWRSPSTCRLSTAELQRPS